MRLPVKNFPLIPALLKLYYSIIIFSIIILLSACPYSSPYKLDKESLNETDKTLMGKWATMITAGNGKQEPMKLQFSEENDKEYNVYFIGFPNAMQPYSLMRYDTLKGKAFISNVANWRFLNIEIQGQTYISEIVYKDNKLSLLPLAECFTAKYIRSNSELRTSVEIHFKTRLWPLYDESLCLRNMVRVN